MTMLRALLVLAVACGQSAAPAPVPAPAPAGSGSYAGRPIAQTMSYLGADWLERPEREEREQPERVLDALALAHDGVAADVGAGTGYFTARLARRVARVYATDLQPQMRERIEALHLANVEVRAATEHDSGLPAGCCDLVLLVDVYHELADPPGVMATIHRALKPHGRLVLVEYRGEDPAVPIKPEHKMTIAQIRRELEGLGFAFVDSLEFLPDQRVVIFAAK